ncbi:MAG TPA: hypothetical protein VMY39_03595 [Planctomycetota bacterium]|nr:hypothetical protein [Planctomycetota bacterium]
MSEGQGSAGDGDVLAGTVVSVGIHALMLAALLTVLMVVVPKFEKIFENFGTDLPALTTVLLAAGRYCLEEPGYVLLIVVVALGADAGVTYLLRSQNDTSLAGMWNVAVIVLLGAGLAGIVLGVFLPLVWLMTSVGQQAGG